MNNNNPIEVLTDFFTQLPGVGHRTSSRYVEFISHRDEAELKEIGNIFSNLKKHIQTCRTCNLTHLGDKCPVCSNQHRDQKSILIVKSSSDVKSLERAGQWKGLYHVLGGLLNPMKDIGPEKLSINMLEKRLASGKIKEVIIGTNFDPDGDMTALYLKKIGQKHKIKMTRLARGLPTGADLEYMDEETLKSAITHRD